SSLQIPPPLCRVCRRRVRPRGRTASILLLPPRVLVVFQGASQDHLILAPPPLTHRGLPSDTARACLPVAEPRRLVGQPSCASDLLRASRAQRHPLSAPTLLLAWLPSHRVSSAVSSKSASERAEQPCSSAVPNGCQSDRSESASRSRCCSVIS